MTVNNKPFNIAYFDGILGLQKNSNDNDSAKNNQTPDPFTHTRYSKGRKAEAGNSIDSTIIKMIPFINRKFKNKFQYFDLFLFP